MSPLPPPVLQRSPVERSPRLISEMPGSCECILLTDLLMALTRIECKGQISLRGLNRQRQALVNLALIDANYSGEWMGLPQELVDMIFEYLRMDWDTLASCSLTCRALFCSARRVIHERLYVAGPRAPLFLNRLTKWCWIYNRRYFRVLSLADNADLTPYTRHLIVDAGQVLTPRSLRPYIPTFQKYVWLTSITLTRFDPTPFLPVFDHCFFHLSHSIKSLHLISPQGPPGATMDFISRFQNLDDVEFNPVPKPPRRLQEHQTPLKPGRRFAPLGGTLRIVNTDSRRANSLETLLHLPGGLHFRSLQFVCCTDVGKTGIMQKCSSTVESVTYTFHCREFASLVACVNFIFTAHIGTCRFRGRLLRVQPTGLPGSSCFRSSDRNFLLRLVRPHGLAGRDRQHNQVPRVH